MNEFGPQSTIFAANSHKCSHTTIALQRRTKEKLDNIRAPGQCYDGFISELVDYWEKYRIGSSLCGTGTPVIGMGS
jgi:hypothetical protein